MSKRRISPLSGYLFYLHILPRHFGKDFVANFGAEVFTFVVNFKHPIPRVGEILHLANCRKIEKAVVISVLPTADWALKERLTYYDTTVHAHLTDDTVVDAATMNYLIEKRGWKFLTINGTVRTHH